MYKINFNKRNHILTLMATFFLSVSYAQSFPEKDMKKKLKAIEIEMDTANGDGVFKAKGKKSKKWGMYQWMYEGTEVQELIPMQYDRLNDIPYNGKFSAVYIKGKIGFYLSKWSYNDEAKQTVECLYDEYQRFNIKGSTYLAVKKEGLWGWVDWLTGEEHSEFKYNTKEELPMPSFEQKYWPEE